MAITMLREDAKRHYAKTRDELFDQLIQAMECNSHAANALLENYNHVNRILSQLSVRKNKKTTQTRANS